jgi:hypothetical protein
MGEPANRLIAATRHRHAPRPASERVRGARHPDGIADVVLALQRSVGNAALARSPPRVPARASGPTLARKPTLSDPATGEYTDGPLTLTYVGSDGEGHGWFLEYSKLVPLQKLVNGAIAAIKAAKAAKDDDPAARYRTAKASELTAYVLQSEWASIVPLLTGTLYIEGVGGALRNVNVPNTFNAAAAQGINTSLLGGAAIDGPLTREESYGSRLPGAKGTLHVEAPHARYNNLAAAADAKRLREDLLLALGVREKAFDKYDDVSVATTANAAAVSGAALPAAAVQTIAANVVYVSTATAPPARAWARAATKLYQTSFTDADAPARKALQKSWTSLGPPAASGWKEKGDLEKEDRSSQEKAMKGWNALGAIAWAKHEGVAAAQHADLTKHWEWLHVQAASLGGETSDKNLVAGSFAVNSAMTPWEAKLRRWREKKGKATLKVSFTPSGTAVGPIATRVDIRVGAQGHPSLTDTADSALVSFEPITGRVVDRLSFGIEKAEQLTTVRRPYDLRPEAATNLAGTRSGTPGASKAAWAIETAYKKGSALAEEGGGPLPDGGSAAGHTDYHQGIADAKAGTAPHTAGAQTGRNHYHQGIADAQAGNAPQTTGAHDGHTDYHQGVADAQAANAPQTTGAQAGHTDYHQGIADARNHGVPATAGAQTGHNDYTAGGAAVNAGLGVGATTGEQAGYDDAVRLARKRDHSPPPTDRKVKPKS